jgi:GNAT acetyltransferase-like protein
MAPARDELVLRWHTHIRELLPAWRECFPADDGLRSFALHTAVEDSRLSDVELHYLAGEDDRGAACVVPCFAFEVCLASLSSHWLRRAVSGVRTVFPRFLRMRLFVVGSPISTCSDLLGIKDLADERRWGRPKLSRLFDEIIRKSQSLGIGLVLIKEFETAVAEILRAKIADKFFFVESLPTTYLDLPPRESGGYFAAIRSRYRNKLKKRKAVGRESQLTWEVVPSCRGYEEEIHRLYLQVVDHSDFVFERLNRPFFAQVEASLGEAAFFILGFRLLDGVKRLVACELVICDRTTMHPLYSGFDYWVKRDTDLYFNAFYQVIEEAERRGFARVHLGQTAYEVKAELGVRCTKLFLGVHHTNRLVKAVLWHARAFLLPSTKFPERDVFAEPPTPRKNGRKPAAVPVVSGAKQPAA